MTPAIIVFVVVFLAVAGAMLFVMKRPGGGPAPFGGMFSSVAGGSRLSAADMLTSCRELRRENASWETIFARLNPSGDRKTQELLIRIRGPHMFAPHLGLRVIETGCESALGGSESADAIAALQEAIRQAEPFTR